MTDQDARQELRLRRHSWATLTSLMVVALLWAAYGFGNLSRHGAIDGTVLIVAWIVVFYAILRSGFNRRFADPSLTAPQLLAAILTMTYVRYFADRGRGALLVVYLVSFLFACSASARNSCSASPRPPSLPTRSW